MFLGSLTSYYLYDRMHNQYCFWAISSVGRAPALHAVGH